MESAAEGVEGGTQSGGRFVGDRLELGPAADLDHDLRVQGLDEGVVGAVGAYDDVAGQQQPDVAVGVQGRWASGGLQAPRMR